MSQFALESFGAYKKARELFDLVVNDMAQMMKDPRCYRLVAQQTSSADSICANIEEGYGRLSRAEYIRFIDFARGSARETRGRYERLATWLPQDIIQHRVALADEIIAILTTTLETLRRQLQKSNTSVSYLKEEDGTPWLIDDDLPSTPDPRP